MSEKTCSAESIVEKRVVAMLGVQLCGLLAMMIVTYRLWVPFQDGGDVLSVPRVPVASVLNRFPGWLQPVFTVAFLLGSLVTIGRLIKTGVNGRIRWTLLITSLFFIALISFDQQRFLPWTLQSLIVFFFCLLFSGRQTLQLGRVLLITIYIYSAISKLDYQFVKTTGREILHAFAGLMHLDIGRWHDRFADLVVIAFPLCELLIGIGLAFATTRLLAMVMACLMHLSLIAALGPWGLDHAESVLLWNMLLAVQLGILYWPIRRQEDNGSREFEPVKAGEKRSVIFWPVLILLCVYPALEKVNLLDHWPAWGLYSPQSSRCRLKVAEWKAAQLPDHFQEFLSASGDPLEETLEFDFAKWMMKKKNVPIYPQDRYQFALARYLVDRYELGRAYSVEIQSASNWWTGRRRTERLANSDKLDAAAKKFLGNTVGPSKPGMQQ